MSRPENNSEPFLVLVTGAQRMLHAFILRLVPSLADADDILQETNLVLWSKQAEFTPGTDFRAWAFRVARYQVMAYRKRQSLDRLVFGEELIDRLARLGEARRETFDDKRELLIRCLRAAQPVAAATAGRSLRQTALRPPDRRAFRPERRRRVPIAAPHAADADALHRGRLASEARERRRPRDGGAQRTISKKSAG